MTKAKTDGVYEIGGGRFKVKAGSPIPAGAEFKAAGEAAGDMRNPQSATIVAGEVGIPNRPDETTEGTGPSETTGANPNDSPAVGPETGEPKQPAEGTESGEQENPTDEELEKLTAPESSKPGRPKQQR